MKKKFFIVYMLLLGINRILSSSVFGDDIKKIFVLLFFFFLPLYSYAQITIEERVEIDPQSILPNYPEPQYTPCGPYPTQTDFDNPYQVIWNGGWLYIDPYQQLFNHQGNVYENYALSPQYTYDVEIIQGGEYCWIQKAGYTDQVAGEFIEPEIIGDQLMNISGEELIGTGQWLVLQGCWVDEKEFPSKYTIHFERDIPAGTEVIVRITGEGSTINYHTIVETPLLSIENGTELDTLYHYYGRWIDVLADLNESYYEGHPYCWKCGGELPSSVTLTLEVIQGQQYGSLYDVETDETGLSFSNIITETGKGSLLSYEYGYRFKFIADGVQPDITQPGIVTIRCTPSDGDINTIEFSFPVAYNEFPPQQGILVQFAEPVLAPGDTTQILLKRRNPDGTLEDFSQWDSFEIGMIEGCEAGKILVDTTLDVYFAQAYQPIKFVADSNITETDTVVVRVGLIELIIGKRAKTGRKEEEATTSSTSKNTEEPNPLLEKPTTYCFVGEIEWGLLGDGNAVVEVEEHTIMLGETKYYQAKYPDPLSNKLVIEEVEPGSDGVPQLNGGLPIDVWGNNPASVVECDTCGEKLGVYWEKEKPMVNGQNLPTGLIRLVGKYWHIDSTYIISIKAKRNDDSASIEIRITKPDSLGNSVQARNLNNGIDINGHDYSIDSMCIKWAGIYGFPPQYIKGQYVGESVYDNDLHRVTPGYRYEAWTTEFEIHNSPNIRNGMYWVTWESMGTGGAVPTNHQNLRYMTYETTPHSVWYFIDRYSNIEHSPTQGGWRVLGDRNRENNRLTFYDYPMPNREYTNIRDRIYRTRGLNPKVENGEANEEARIEFIEYMKNEYRDGLVHRAAQSRAASSYGPIQPLYRTVLGYDYPRDRIPEDLNNIDIFWPFALDHYSNLLTQRIGNVNNNNWTGGFEAVLTRVYQGWNPGKTGYGASVISRGNNFKPLKVGGE